MPRSERRRREALVPTTERPAPSPEVVAPVPAAVLRMQAAIGNRATGDVLARERDREWTGPTRTEEKPPPAPDGTVTIAGFGRYKLHSAQKVSDSGMAVSFDAAKDAARFTAASTSGKPIATVTIGMGGRTITLHDVIIVSVQHSGGEGRDPVLVVELNAGKIDFD